MINKLGKWAPLLMAFTIIILLLGGFQYLNRMKRTLWKESVSNVLEVTEQGGKSFDTYINRGKYLLHNIAAGFAPYDSSEAEEIGNRLDLYDNGAYTFSVIDLTHEVVFINSEETYPLSDEKVKEYLSLPESGVLEPYINEQNGHRTIGYYEKFTFADKAQGMICNSELLTEVSEKFALSFYDNAGFSYIVNADGEILLRSGSENRNRTFSNIYDVVALDNNTDEDVNALRNGMSGGKRGVMRLNFNEDEHIFAFVPLNNTEGWYLVSIVPNRIITENDSKMIMSSRFLILGIVVTMFIFTTFMIISIYTRQQLRAGQTEVLYREELFDMLVANTDDIFLMLDADMSTVIYVSPNIERVTGLSVEDIKKDMSCLQTIIDESENKNVMKNDMDIPMNGSVSFEGNYIHRDTGVTHWFVETVYHTEIGDMERYIIVLADRSVEKQKEATLSEALEIAKVANESKSTFLANMSHDIRTPMNAIVGLATLLQRDAEKPNKVREHTEKITASSKHLLGLINDVLDMSKIETGKTSLNITEFNLNELVQELDSIIRLQAKARKQKFEIIRKDIKSENLMGDRQRISQVLMNILSNAVKYTPEEGSVTLTIMQFGHTTRDIAHIRFVVEDNGIGMSEEYQEVIFQPFTREIRTTVNQIQGTGLGMAITKNLVEIMGGTISVKSKQGEGSTFTIDFDLRISRNENDAVSAVKQNSAIESTEENTIEGRHFLCAEDNDLNAEILCELLEMEGATAEVAVDGQEAVEKFAAAPAGTYDAVLMDVQMPRMNGYEATRAIRKLDHPQAANIPIVAMTANAFASDINDALESGMNEHIAKPVDMKKLINVLNELWRKLL